MKKVNPTSMSQNNHLKKTNILCSNKSKTSIIASQDGGVTFDAGRILDRYQTMRQQQHNQLARTNLSQEHKRLLFGFSQSYYLPPCHDNNRLVIQNHPLKGRIVMPIQKYQQYRFMKHKQELLRPSQNISSSIRINTEHSSRNQDFQNNSGHLAPLAQVSQEELIPHRSQQI